MVSSPERKRLVLIGVDGMDYDVTRRLLDRLPNLRRLSESGAFFPLPSVFPPDSIPAWITAYTGLDPSEHGILESVDYFAKGADRLRIDTSVFRGRTFWDAAGASGSSVCVINPFMAYPVWPVHGVMVNGPVFISGEIQSSNPALTEGIPIPRSLGGIEDFPTTKTLRAFCEKVVSDTREQGEFGRALFLRARPDLFFQTFLTMDRLQHFLWRYWDREDPAYPGPTEFADAIPGFHEAIDAEIGKFAALLEPGDHLVVLSDHGHGRRCTHCFNINEYLRRRGDVVSRAGRNPLSPARLLEFAKNSFLAVMDRLGLQDYVKVVAKFIPRARELKKGRHLTDHARNRAYVSEFTGTNPFGGVCINRGLVGDYESFREDLIRDLTEVQFGGEGAFRWIKKREEVYAGPFLDRFPDVLFEMQPSLGVNWSLHTRLFVRNPTHKALSGGHRPQGVFLANHAAPWKESVATIRDLFPAVQGFFKE
jgi:predicted AlkP superfamily phosphohydrolase/phosphomutase